MTHGIPGHFVGKDTKDYRWVVGQTCPGYILQRQDNHAWFTVLGIKPEDWARAKDALDELIADEKNPWIEWTDNMNNGNKYRVRKDGSKAQHYDHGWVNNVAYPGAYKLGQKLVIEAMEAERDEWTDDDIDTFVNDVLQRIGY